MKYVKYCNPTVQGCGFLMSSQRIRPVCPKLGLGLVDCCKMTKFPVCIICKICFFSIVFHLLHTSLELKHNLKGHFYKKRFDCKHKRIVECVYSENWTDANWHAWRSKFQLISSPHSNFFLRYPDRVN